MRRGVPWAHWATLALGLLMLLGVLTFHAYAQAGPAPVPQQDQHLSQSIRTVPAGTVALTFYGGPDPKRTPKILDELARHHAHATFLVLGVQVNDNPDLVRRMIAEGHEVGIAGFRADDVNEKPDWTSALTQAALAGAAGVNTTLFGLPTDVPHREDQDMPWGDRAAISAIADLGAMIRLNENDPATVDSVTDMLAALEPGGYRFETVSRALGKPGVMVSAGPVSRFGGELMALAQRYGGVVLFVLSALIAVAAILALLRTVMQLGLAHTARRLRREREQQPPPWFAPPVSVIIPAYNEAANIVDAVRSMMANTHLAEVEVIVVDDGSTDGTGDLVEALALPGVQVLRQPNLGKPAALNAGIFLARNDILVLVDGDTIFEPGTIGHLVQPLADPRVGAVSGNTKVSNRRGLLGRWQHLEYCAGSNLDRQILDAFECIPTVPGAVGAFRREALDAIGGISADTIAEDTDATIAINRANWRVTYQQSARAWTEAPSTLRGLYRQRYRWSYGTFQSMWKHRGALRERGLAGKMGRYGLIYLLGFHLVLPLLAPAMDICAIYGLCVADAPRALFIWVAFLVIQTASAGYALHLDGEPLRPLWAFPLQQLVYRQLMYLVVIQSLVTALNGTHLRWQSVQRTGEAAQRGQKSREQVCLP